MTGGCKSSVVWMKEKQGDMPAVRDFFYYVIVNRVMNVVAY